MAFVKLKLNISKRNIIICSVTLSMLQTLLSFFTDRLIFAQDARNGIKYLFFKLLFFFVVLMAWYFVIGFIKSIFVDKNRNMMIYLKIFFFFFSFYSVILLLIYPGNWIWDEVFILTEATKLNLFAWQHILTSVFYILSLMIFPMPVLIVILQYTIISAIISYFIGKAYNNVSHNCLWIGILFLLPPVITHVLYPMRLCIFAFLELLFFFIINEEKQITRCKTMIFAVVLNVILAVWRTECIFFVAFIPICFLYKKYPIRITVIVTTIIFAVAGIVTSINNYYAGSEDEIGYKVTGIVAPFHELLLKDYENNDGKVIEEIQDIVDIDKAVLYESGNSAYWADVYDNINTEDDFKRMEYVLLKLIKKYPLFLLKERWYTFHSTEKVLDKYGNVCTMVRYGETDMSGTNGNVMRGFIKSSPINVLLRENVLLFLYSKGESTFIGKIIRITYNLMFPILLLSSLLIYATATKNGVLLLSVLFLLTQTFAVFFTAPSICFMYYFPIYICGYGLFFSCVCGEFKK